jgi:peroxiredoxin
MLDQQANAPFPIVADPDLKLYREFGVETSILSVLNPKAWPSAIGGLIKVGPGFPSHGESALGLPADFLINSKGKVIALKYGSHADDHWDFDEVVALARTALGCS